MNRTEKVEEVELLRGLFQEAGVVIVSHYTGLSVAEMTALRGDLSQADARLKVVKNRLVKLAIQDTPANDAAPLFQGPVAIAWSKDAVAVSKAAVDYAKKNEKFKLIGGVLGESVLDADGITALSKMPPIEEMRAKLVGVLNAPAGKFVRTLNEPGSQFVRTLNAPGGQLANVLRSYQAKLEAA